MKKVIVLLIFITLLFSCNSKEEEYNYLVKGYTENYLVLITKETLICINYDNREIDDDKLIQLLDLNNVTKIKIEKGLEDQIINLLEHNKIENESLLKVYVNNKSLFKEEITSLMNTYNDNDLTYIIEKIDNQEIYFFDNLEKIKDSANYLELWLKQVKSLERRKDL
ncbi:MAG: hypothetical protein ACPKM0_09940 [Pleomorphochaeta sp.]